LACAEHCIQGVTDKGSETVKEPWITLLNEDCIINTTNAYLHPIGPLLTDPKLNTLLALSNLGFQKGNFWKTLFWKARTSPSPLIDSSSIGHLRLLRKQIKFNFFELVDLKHSDMDHVSFRRQISLK